MSIEFDPEKPLIDAARVNAKFEAIEEQASEEVEDSFRKADDLMQTFLRLGEQWLAEFDRALREYGSRLSDWELDSMRVYLADAPREAQEIQRHLAASRSRELGEWEFSTDILP